MLGRRRRDATAASSPPPGVAARGGRARRHARRLGRGAHHLIAWLGSAAAVLILLVAVAIWRLMQGPIELDRLVPYVQALLDRSALGLEVTVAGVRLGIDPRTHELNLWVRNVHVARPGGEPVAKFPEVATSFSLGPLLHGRLAPTRVSIERPVLYLARDTAGKISLRLGDSDDPASTLAPQTLDDLVGSAGHDQALAALRHVRVHDATVVLHDQASGRGWQAKHVAAALDRSADGISGDIAMALPLDVNTPELHASFRYSVAGQQLDLLLAVDRLDPAALAATLRPLFPALQPLEQVTTPVSGTLTGRLSLADGRPEGMRIDLGFGEGAVRHAMLPSGRIGFTQGELHAVYAPEKSELHLEQLALDLGGGARLVLDGTLDGLPAQALTDPSFSRTRSAGKLGVVLSHVPLASFDRFWPASLSPGGREWVLKNIQEGTLDELSVQLALGIDAAAGSVQLAGVRGALRYRDLSVVYFPGLVPVRKVGGTATFTDKRFDFTATGGVIKSVKVTGAALQLTELDMPMEWATIDVNLVGPLQDILEIIDAKPLHYAHAVGLDPARVGGRADAQLRIKLPLMNDLKLDAVDFAVKGTLTGTSIAKVALDRNLSDGNFALEIGKTGLKLKGNSRFDGIATAVEGEAFFRPTANGPRARYRIGMKLDDEARKRLDFDLAPGLLNGIVGVDLTYTAGAAGRSEAQVGIDLQAATLTAAEAGWKKLADAPGTAKLVLELENDAIVRVPRIDIRASGLDGRFAVVMAPKGGQIERVEIKRLALGDNDLSGSVARRNGGGWNADLHGARLDVGRLLKQSDNGKGEAADPPPLAFSGRFDRLILGPRRTIDGVTMQLLRTDGVWQSARLDGSLGNGHRLAVQLGSEGDGHRLTVRTDDLGSLARVLGITDKVAGGMATLTAQVAEEGGRRTLRGSLEGSDFYLVRAPLIAKVLALPSFSGIAGAMSGGGLHFSTLRADFRYGGNRVALPRLICFGEALGVTATGWIDIDRDVFDLQGTVAPAFAVNSLLGNVPVIGRLFTGGEGQAMFAANYHVSGPIDEPQVTVNPLSALAPGILRRLFDLSLPLPQQEQEAAQ